MKGKKLKYLVRSAFSDMVVVVLVMLGLWRNVLFTPVFAYVTCTTLTATMDALKAEIATKRKALHDDPLLAGRTTKYMRRGEIERLREEQEQKERAEKQESLHVSGATGTSVENPISGRVSNFFFGYCTWS